MPVLLNYFSLLIFITDTTITLIHVEYLLKPFILSVRGAKDAKYAKGAGGIGSVGSARGLRRSKRILDHSATYCTKEEEKKEEGEEEESQQSTQQSTISTSSTQQSQLLDIIDKNIIDTKPPVEGSIIMRSITSIVETSIISPTSTQSTRSYHSTPVIETDIIPLMWPNFEEYKASIEKWLNSNYANYLKEIEDRKWVNAFTGNFYAK
ncbi:hypothetical protein C1646_755934 [Rhizophagus diaphanus]|nr:hypothetical protein C1646_755934 [Rhizophagus diaphanus] [Rhizophagus sp. MUCL 43196]